MICDAPTRLSTTTCFPSDAPSSAPSRRATMSLGPPVGDGTITRMFLVGYVVWLCAASGETAMTHDAAAICRQRLDRHEIPWCFIRSLPFKSQARTKSKITENKAKGERAEQQGKTRKF